MEFKRLQEVNKKLTTVDIKGKEYVEVNKRIMAFRELYPDGAIINEIVSNVDGVVIIKSTVMCGAEILATAHAYEKEGAGFINKTSYIENCETSAVGRALGMCGIGVDTSVASYEEVANAVKQQEFPELDQKVSATQLKAITQRLKDAEVDMDKFFANYKIKDLSELTSRQYADALIQLTKIGV